MCSVKLRGKPVLPETEIGGWVHLGDHIERQPDLKFDEMDVLFDSVAEIKVEDEIPTELSVYYCPPFQDEKALEEGLDEQFKLEIESIGSALLEAILIASGRYVSFGAWAPRGHREMVCPLRIECPNCMRKDNGMLGWLAPSFATFLNYWKISEACFCFYCRKLVPNEDYVSPTESSQISILLQKGTNEYAVETRDRKNKCLWRKDLDCELLSEEDEAEGWFRPLTVYRWVQEMEKAGWSGRRY